MTTPPPAFPAADARVARSIEPIEGPDSADAHRQAAWSRASTSAASCSR